MNKCKTCSADPVMCEYCIYNKNEENNKDTCDEKIIFYDNKKFDNGSKKICPICKKIYTGYPAISRKDNKTLICSDCGMEEIQGPLEELLEEYGIRY